MNMNQGHLFRRISETPRDHCYKEQMVNCWICEKWVEINLQWVPGVSGKEDHDPIFLHLECDDYQPEVLIRN